MKLASLFTLFFLFTSNLFAEVVTDPYKNIKYLELNNGLKVYMLSDSKSVNTQIELRVDVGVSVETKENAGITHLLEHIIFRDQRVPYNDYLDYLEEEGATFVNGYTKRHTTEYYATISSDKSYFLAKTFAQMIFDKNVTSEDLEIEKKALQVEVGEMQWYHKIGYYISTFFKSISTLFPDRPNIFVDSFGLEKYNENINSYISNNNNSKFTLDEVMKHYRDYYYPKNMTLKIVGNFDEVKMQKLIKDEYGIISRSGDKHSQELAYNAKLKDEKYNYFSTGENSKNLAYIGTRYIIDDYKQYLTLSAYTDYLSSKMQKLLRNKLGQTYSVSPYESSFRNAGLFGISFESLHDDFDENLALIQEQISADINKMDKDAIEEALVQSRLYYSSLEHDSETLMDLIGTQEYIQKYQNIYDKTPYEIFNSITHESFQAEISKSFVDKYRYLYVYRDYYLFPFDLLVLSLLMIVSFIVYFRKVSKLKLRKNGILYTNRDVRLTRKLTGKFISVVVFLIIIVIVSYVDAWIQDYLFTLLFDNASYMYTFSQPMQYLYHILDFIFLFAIYILLLSTIWNRFFTKIELTDEHLYIVGLSIMAISKDEIVEVKKVSWSISKFCKIAGVSLLFFKPLVMVKYESDKIIYLRAKKADELVEDLNKWIEK